MPGISKERMAQGAYAASQVTPDLERDWSIPTDAATLRGRVLATPDQTRYGRATDDLEAS